MLQFQNQINYDFKTRKNQANVTLVMVHVIVITPIKNIEWELHEEMVIEVF